MFDRTSRVVLGVVAAFAFGMIAGAQLERPSTPSMSQALEAAPAVVSAPAPATPAARARAVRLERVPPATAPAVQQHVKRLLNAGTNPEMAAEGFGNARELMTVAYAGCGRRRFCTGRGLRADRLGQPGLRRVGPERRGACATGAGRHG